MNVPEGIQIFTLQKIIEFQDSVIKAQSGADISTVWRNECYRLTVHNKAIENELRESLQSTEIKVRDERRELHNILMHAFNELLHEVQTKTSNKINALDRRLGRLRTRVSEVDRVFRDIQLKSSQKSPLTPFHVYSIGIQTGEYEAPSLPTSGSKTTAVDGESSVATIAALLSELKALEAEAKQLLIKK